MMEEQERDFTDAEMAASERELERIRAARTDLTIFTAAHVNVLRDAARLVRENNGRLPSTAADWFDRIRERIEANIATDRLTTSTRTGT